MSGPHMAHLLPVLLLGLLHLLLYGRHVALSLCLRVLELPSVGLHEGSILSLCRLHLGRAGVGTT